MFRLWPQKHTHLAFIYIIYCFIINLYVIFIYIGYRCIQISIQHVNIQTWIGKHLPIRHQWFQMPLNSDCVRVWRCVIQLICWSCLLWTDPWIDDSSDSSIHLHSMDSCWRVFSPTRFRIPMNSKIIIGIESIMIMVDNENKQFGKL